MLNPIISRRCAKCNRPSGEFYRCDGCRKKKNDIARRKRKEHQTTGRCRCGNKPTEGQKNCAECQLRMKQRRLKYQKTNRCQRCGEAADRGAYCNDCAEKKNNLNNQVRRTRKQVVFDHYGPCQCCNENNLIFLTIDHINGDGAEHRRSLGGCRGNNFYRWIIKNNFPDYLRALCFNCNSAIGAYGYCPHHDKPQSIEQPIKPSIVLPILRFSFKDFAARKLVGICKRCNAPRVNNTASCQYHLDLANWREQQTSRQLKLDALKKYGSECACCGVNEFEFLTVNHDEGGGRQHKLSRGINSIYRWLKTNNYPDGYSTLCWNCNAAFGLFGHCPHQPVSLRT